MRDIFRRKFASNSVIVARVVAITLFLFFPIVFPACGGGGSGGADEETTGISGPPQNSPNAPGSISEEPAEDAPQQTIEDLINSPYYRGHLIVKMSDSAEVSLSSSATPLGLIDEDTRLQNVQKIVELHPPAQLKPFVENSKPADVQLARIELEGLSNKRVSDVTSRYNVVVAAPEEAIELVKELKNAPGVEYVYPAVKGMLTGIASTPDLQGHQSYLGPEATTWGLNAEAAWNFTDTTIHNEPIDGVTGEGITIVDPEGGLNFQHEDLGLVAAQRFSGGNYIDQPNCAPGFPYEFDDCPATIAHGTAVAGVLVAKDNGHGIHGFAPSAFFLQANDDPIMSGPLQMLTDGLERGDPYGDDLEPGAVWVIEVQAPSKFSGTRTCDGAGDPDCQYGGIPVEAWADEYEDIERAVAYGITVVEGAGNGLMDLDNENIYNGDWSFLKSLKNRANDTGAIMVGASWGAYPNYEEKIHDVSNYGSRVDVFAWGNGVATTGYPYGLYGWSGTTPPLPGNNVNDPNNYYINNFGGTSSAAAMVGGAAALLQSYAKEKMGHRRYIMPIKLREILVNSGVPQRDSTGHNIGKQPRIDVALNLAKNFIEQKIAEYPELQNDEMMTWERMTALRQDGIGLVCWKFEPENSDPACADRSLYPAGTKLSKDMDFDGDGKADLVQWTNGTWKLDLSSTGPGENHFGSWDVVIEHEPIDGKWVWPYVEDMNSDARTDFVVYDKEHGKFYIAYNDSFLMKRNEWHGWDRVIDYSSQWTDTLEMDSRNSKYSRPAIGDLNEDGWNDITIACSDGWWRMDYGGPNETDLGSFENQIKYLSDAELAAEPGWAYPTIGSRATAGNQQESYSIIHKTPNSPLPDVEGELFLQVSRDTSHTNDYAAGAPHIFGGNEDVLVLGGFCKTSDAVVSIKKPDGNWYFIVVAWQDAAYFTEIVEVNPLMGWGGTECVPVAADFNGDGYDDRAVMCPDEWRISYSIQPQEGGLCASNHSEMQLIPHNYNTSVFTLPGRPYSGGISYEYTKELIRFYQEMYPEEPPPIPVDMVSSHGCRPGGC